MQDLPASERPDPETEFGPVEQYARELADQVPQRALPWWRHPLLQVVVAASFLVCAVRLALGWFDADRLYLAVGVGLPVVLVMVTAVVLPARRLFRRDAAGPPPGL